MTFHHGSPWLIHLKSLWSVYFIDTFYSGQKKRSHIPQQIMEDMKRATIKRKVFDFINLRLPKNQSRISATTAIIV